jgi:hypothetical protein
MLIEDDGLALACADYMKSNGYLVFDSMKKALAHFGLKVPFQTVVAPPALNPDSSPDSN